MKRKCYIMLCLSLVAIALGACGDDTVVIDGAEDSSIDFTIKLIDDMGEDVAVSQSDVYGLIRIRYDGEVYCLDERARSAGKIGLSLLTGADGKKTLVFGGIDGTREYDNASFTLDCASGKDYVVTFSNKFDKNTYVRSYALNGKKLAEPVVECEFELLPREQDMVGGNLFLYGLEILPVDAEGGDLLKNEEFVENVKSSTFTFRGVTSDIVVSTSKDGDEFPTPEDVASDVKPDYAQRYKLYVNTHTYSDGSKRVRMFFGPFLACFYYCDQELVINWYDGTKDVVNFTLVDMPAYYTNPNSALYNPELPEARYEMKLNGEALQCDVEANNMWFEYKRAFSIGG